MYPIRKAKIAYFVDYLNLHSRLLSQSENLKKELIFLKEKKRPEIVSAIAEARSHGDLKENAEYHAAREQQGLVEAKIKDIESKLNNAEIIDSSQTSEINEVVFGSTIELLNIDDKKKITYTLVGEDEADFSQNKISFNSPIAKGLIGKKVGMTREFFDTGISIPVTVLSLSLIHI